MKFLVSNDDGFGAPGIEGLIELCEARGEVVVVAPDEPRSGVGHAVMTHQPLVLTEHAPGRFSLSGMPADCVRVGLTELAADADWVIAGINAGGNLGADVYTSGTLAAAREGALLGKPALALSQYVGPNRKIDWRATIDRAAAVFDSVLERGCSGHEYWNANLPHPSDEARRVPIVDSPVDPSPMWVRYEREADTFTWRGNYHGRPRVKDSDVDVCFGGSIALTRMSLRVR